MTDPAKPHIKEFILLHGVQENSQGFISCLWHEEKTPSMSLEPHGENYHCFGCGKSADIYDFAAHFYGLDIKRDFAAIKKRVCEELGLPADKGARTGAPQPVTPETVSYIYTEDRLKRLGKAVFKTDIFGIEAVYPYKNAAGEVDFVECRYPGTCFADGKKKVLSVWFNGSTVKAAGCPVRLYNRDILAAKPDLPVVIHEGAKCAGAATGALTDFVHTAYNGGGKKLSSVDLSPLKGRTVYIYPDDDTDKRVGLATARNLKARLRHELGIEALIVEPVPEARRLKPSGADIVEALQVIPPDKLARRILERHIIEKPRPMFRIDEGYELHAAAAEAAQAINDFDPAVFSRDGVILRPCGGRLRAADLNSVRLLLSEAIYFLYRDRPASPPLDITAAVLAGADKFFRPVREIIPYPVITAEGSVIRESGYDSETQCFFDIPPLEDINSTDEALKILEDAFTDFPFAAQPDRANLYAMMLTFILRRRINSQVPAFIVQAPVQGTGKSKLTTVALSVLTGGQVTASFLPKDETEIQKTLGGMIMSGRPYFFFDNLKHRLSSSFLEGIITGRHIDFRILGSNSIFTAENNFVFAFTSNNPQMDKDLVRRMGPINLDANREHPEDTQGIEFRHPDIENYVLGRRARILSALLCLAQMEGPWDGPVKGSFEAWSRITGGVLAASGVTGFLENIEEFAANAYDEDASMTAFVEAWARDFGEVPVFAKDLEPCADEAELIGDEVKSKMKTFAHILKKNLNRIVAGYKITRYGRPHGKTTYRLSRVVLKTEKPISTGFLDKYNP
jgi:hypothetical protein